MANSEAAFAVYYNDEGEIIDVENYDKKNSPFQKCGQCKKGKDKGKVISELRQSPLDFGEINGIETTVLLFKKGKSPCLICDPHGNCWDRCPQ